MSPRNLEDLLLTLVQLPDETEWVEFKHNNDNPTEIGEQLSAVSNSAALHGKDRGFILWGIEDKTHTLGDQISTQAVKGQRSRTGELALYSAQSANPLLHVRGSACQPFFCDL